MLLDVGTYWPGHKLLIFNTHLDPRNVNNRVQQVKEICQFMESTFVDLEKLDSKTSLAKCSVLLLGDFNVSAAWEEYHQLVQMLGGKNRVVDLFDRGKELQQKYTYEPTNSLATEIHSSPRRIDFIFGINQFQFTNSGSLRTFVPVEVTSFRIETQPFGKELSDHWPQIVTLKPQ